MERSSDGVRGGERGRERVGGRQGGRQAGRETGRQAGRQGGREAGRERLWRGPQRVGEGRGGAQVGGVTQRREAERDRERVGDVRKQEGEGGGEGEEGRGREGGGEREREGEKGREGGREGEKGREGGREGGSDRGREGGREGGRMGGREGGREGGRGDERRRGPATVSRSDCATRIARGPRGKLLAARSQRDKARHRSPHGSVRFRRNGRWAKRTPQLAGPRKPAKGDLGKKRSVRGPPKRTMRMHVSAPIHSATRGGLETLQKGPPLRATSESASRRDRAAVVRLGSGRAPGRRTRL